MACHGSSWRHTNYCHVVHHYNTIGGVLTLSLLCATYTILGVSRQDFFLWHAMKYNHDKHCHGTDLSRNALMAISMWDGTVHGNATAPNGNFMTFAWHCHGSAWDCHDTPYIWYLLQWVSMSLTRRSMIMPWQPIMEVQGIAMVHSEGSCLYGV